MTADVALDDACLLADVAADDGPVDAVRRLCADLFREVEMRRVVLGRDHDARRVLVEAVDDARTDLTVDAGEILAVIEQCIDERPRVDARCRMHDHAARLVDDDDVAVLVEDGERDILRQDLDGLCLRQMEDDFLPCLQLVVGLAHTTADECLPLCDDLLDMGARERGLHAREEAVETLIVLVCCKHLRRI